MLHHLCGGLAHCGSEPFNFTWTCSGGMDRGLFKHSCSGESFLYCSIIDKEKCMHLIIQRVHAQLVQPTCPFIGNWNNNLPLLTLKQNLKQFPISSVLKWQCQISEWQFGFSFSGLYFSFSGKKPKLEISIPCFPCQGKATRMPFFSPFHRKAIDYSPHGPPEGGGGGILLLRLVTVKVMLPSHTHPPLTLMIITGLYQIISPTC